MMQYGSCPLSSLSNRQRNRRRWWWYSIWPIIILSFPSLAFVAQPHSFTKTKNGSPSRFLYHSRTESKPIASDEGNERQAVSSTNIDPEHVWIWEDDRGVDGSGIWKHPNDPDVKKIAKEVTKLVTNWCKNFVLELDLCPWAKASLQTSGAMRFFLVPPLKPETDDGIDLEMFQEKLEQWMERIVEAAAEQFQAEILATESVDNNEASSIQLEKAAIYFVVFLPNDDDSLLPNSFVDFSYWFMDMEENWKEEYDDVIVAPFHPCWTFGQDDGDNHSITACLDYEKRSPYPLVTLVSTEVVENAGAVVTEAIGEHNEQVLVGIETEHKCDSNKKSHMNASVGDLWRSAVYGNS